MCLSGWLGFVFVLVIWDILCTIGLITIWGMESFFYPKHLHIANEKACNPMKSHELETRHKKTPVKRPWFCFRWVFFCCFENHGRLLPMVMFNSAEVHSRIAWCKTIGTFQSRCMRLGDLPGKMGSLNRVTWVTEVQKQEKTAGLLMNVIWLCILFLLFTWLFT